MESVFAFEEGVLGFYTFRIGNAAIYRANCGTLRLLMEAHTFSAFVGNDIVEIVRNRLVYISWSGWGTVFEDIGRLHSGAIGHAPFDATFIDGIVGALGLAGSAVDTFLSDHDRHSGILVVLVGQK